MTLIDKWDAYAKRYPLGQNSYHAEPVQQIRADAIIRRARGRTLDVGGGDGYITQSIPNATLLDISPTRVARAAEAGIPAHHGDAIALPYVDDSYDTVILGEILEHLENPGVALAEGFRVARDRVIISIPLDGWEDETHQWRISLDDCVDSVQKGVEPTKGHQLVLTFQKGSCWPPGYYKTDPSWEEQFGG